MYSATIFESQYDNQTHRKLDFDEWDKFEKICTSFQRDH